MGSSRWEVTHRTQQALAEMENDIVEFKEGRITQSEMDRRYEVLLRNYKQSRDGIAIRNLKRRRRVRRTAL